MKLKSLTSKQKQSFIKNNVINNIFAELKSLENSHSLPKNIFEHRKNFSP